MTAPRSVRRGMALSVVAGAALAGAPAASADPAPTPTVVQRIRCLTDGPVLPATTAGVSNGQRELRWAGLAGLSTGAGVTVAVIDSGVNPLPAFGARLVGGGDLVDPAKGRNGLVDCDGHGTVVAGVIAAAPDTTTGFAGVAPAARILSIRQTSARYAPADGSRGQTSVGDLGTLALAVRRAVAQGARVINISAAACFPAIQGDNAALEAAVADAAAHDVVVVAAAGNVGDGACTPQNPDTGDAVTAALPARLDAVLSVGAVTVDDAPAPYSLRGAWVDLAAPGDHLVSVNPDPRGQGQVDRIITPQGTAAIAGTSFSAPIVAGVAALVRARFPHLTARQVVHRLTVTASHPSGAGERNRAVGYGVVDPRMALTAVLAEEGPAGATAAPRATGLPPAPAVVDDPAPRRIALGGAGLLALGVVAFGVVRFGRRPR